MDTNGYGHEKVLIRNSVFRRIWTLSKYGILYPSCIELLPAVCIQADPISYFLGMNTKMYSSIYGWSVEFFHGTALANTGKHFTVFINI